MAQVRVGGRFASTEATIESAAPEIEPAPLGALVCSLVFKDAESRYWTCQRLASHGARSHAAFLADGTLACIEGQKPLYRPVELDRPVAEPVPIAQVLPDSAIAETRTQIALANAQRDRALELLDQQAQQLSQLDGQLDIARRRAADAEERAASLDHKRVNARAHVRAEVYELRRLTEELAGQLGYANLARQRRLIDRIEAVVQ